MKNTLKVKKYSKELMNFFNISIIIIFVKTDNVKEKHKLILMKKN